VSCSDDKVIRFRDPKDGFKILFEVQTTTIKEWHTLTYLALEPNGHRVAVGSQNGYLFIYDIFEKDLLYGEKIHLGGIEGLDWKGNKICTCSSDLCINIIEL
jgi:WD40 repeat protein